VEMLTYIRGFALRPGLSHGAKELEIQDSTASGRLPAGQDGPEPQPKTFSQTFSHPSLRAARLTAAHAVLPINPEAAQAERHWFESGHPLFSSGLNSAEDQAYGFSSIGWQGASNSLP
jgi:hypothetical protein